MQANNRLAAVEAALERIADPQGQSNSVFTRVYAEEARTAARAADQMAALGVDLSPLAGMAVSVKDLFDIKGDVTLAGSKVLASQPPASQDAEAVRRLRNAGAAIVGKTTMTEFAFSGLGLNPHYGTPLSIWDRQNKRIPGGSSSGAAISITDGMAKIALGTDTGGSCRIPAALNGLVGFKPTARTVPKQGAFPLSYTYDSVGPLAATTDLCAHAYAVLSNTQYLPLKPDCSQLVLAVVKNHVLEDLDEHVAAAFEAALARLAKAGVALHEIEINALRDIPLLVASGGISSAEAYHIHRANLETDAAKFDPRVAARIRLGANTSAADYIELQHKRSAFINGFNSEIYGYDAIAMPTVPLVAPKISSLADDDAYINTNLLMLRNTSIANMADACSISIPCHEEGQPPVGLMLTAANGGDWNLLAAARAIEGVFKNAE